MYMENFMPGSFQLLKKINTGLILDTIRYKGPIPRSEIAKILNLTPATVTNITAELINNNIIVESELGESSGGRKPIMLKINDNSYYIISVYIECCDIKLAVVNMESKIIDFEVIDLREGSDTAIELIKKSIWNLIKRNDIDKSKLLGIGIGKHGYRKCLCNKHEDINCFSKNNDMFKEELELEFNMPVCIDRDVRAMALCESWYGAGRGHNSFICIKAGKDLGLSVINRKQQVVGINNTFGEFGHMKIDPEGRECSCGCKGCLETLASEEAVIKFALEYGYNGVCDLDNIMDKALSGDSAAAKALEKSGFYFGLGISNIINIFNPTLIVIGGNSITLNDIYYNSMLKSIKENTIEGVLKCVNIVRGDLNFNSALRGAALLVLDRIFDEMQ